MAYLRRHKYSIYSELTLCIIYRMWVVCIHEHRIKSVDRVYRVVSFEFVFFLVLYRICKAHKTFESNKIYIVIYDAYIFIFIYIYILYVFIIFGYLHKRTCKRERERGREKRKKQ